MPPWGLTFVYNFFKSSFSCCFNVFIIIIIIIIIGELGVWGVGDVICLPCLLVFLLKYALYILTSTSITVPESNSRFAVLMKINFRFHKYLPELTCRGFKQDGERRMRDCRDFSGACDGFYRRPVF